MKLSVIVPMYNVEIYLRQCIESIINQTYKELEIILVDDGSPDKCGHIADEYAQIDKRIKVVHQQNKGLAAARNVGLSIATGDYIAFVDSDDFISTNMYKEMIEFTDDKPDVILCNYYRVIGGNVIDDGRMFDNAILEREEHLRGVLYGELGNYEAISFLRPNTRKICNVFVMPWNKLYRKDFLNKYQLKYDEELQAHEDTWFNFQVYQYTKKIVTLNNKLYYARMNSQSITRKFKANRVELNEKLVSRIVNTLGKDYFYKKNDILTQSAYLCVLKYLISDIKDYFCNQSNYDSFVNKCKQLSILIKQKNYKQAIYNIDLKLLTIRQKWSIKFLRIHAYSIVLLFSLVRNKCNWLEI